MVGVESGLTSSTFHFYLVSAMSAVQSFDPSVDNIDNNNDIVLDASAIDKALELITEEANPNLRLRVFITGGGCSGFQYGFSFDEQQAEDDTLIEQSGLKVLIDPLSYPYLLGSRICYVEGLEGAKFTVDNPNATTTCSCGSSFSI